MRQSPAVQSAYQQLDNMEAEEVEAITQEAALLWREQQAIFKEMTTIQLQSKVAKVRLAWREAANGPADGPDSSHSPDDLAADAEVVQLKAQLATDEAGMARLQRDLDSSRRTLQQLQADIPSRVVSSRRLTTLRLVMRQQQAPTEPAPRP